MVVKLLNQELVFCIFGGMKQFDYFCIGFYSFYFVMKNLRKSLVVSFSILLSVSVLAQPSLTDEEREYWTDRYLSVSYPLKKIEVSSPFGLRKDPFTGERSSHSGLDLRASYEDVMAMFDGRVERIGSDDRSGNFVILRHGEYTICYCHLSKILFNEGDTIFAGEVVSISGNTGRSTGPHLHITARRKGVVVDPNGLLQYVRSVREECVKALAVEPSVPLGKQDFFEFYANVAMEHQRKYGIPSSVTLSQMALESDYGNSVLARNGKNFFGIKVGSNWDGAKSWHDDDVPGYFRNYNTVWESVDDHSRLLMTSRYKRCRQYSSQDYHNWLVEIKRAGYASAKDYVQCCEGIIKKYKLYLYDQMASNL